MSINNIIIILVVVYIIVQYQKKQLNNVCVALMVAYVCLPVIKFSGERGINSAYIVTLVICVLFGIQLIKKNIIFDRISTLYLAAMSLSTGSVVVGWLVNGNPKASDIINFTGIGQYILGTYLFSRLIAIFNLKKDEVMVKGIKWILGLNIIASIVEIASWKIGNLFIRQFYAYTGKEGPINVEATRAGFVRVFGTFYSPSVLGVMSLLISTYILFTIIEKNKIILEYVVLYCCAVALGLLAFSKLAIIGTPLVMGISIVYITIQERKIKVLKLMLKMCAIMLLPYIIVVSLQWCLGYHGPVKYYYRTAFNISKAMESRYANIDEPSSDEPSNAESSNDASNNKTSNDDEKEGIVSSATQIFKEHPIIGVGPAPIKNEFLGDSEYIGVLHNGGLTNFAIHLILYSVLGIYWMCQKGNRELFTLLAIGISGVSVMVFSYGCVIPFLASCIIKNEENIATQNL